MLRVMIQPGSVKMGVASFAVVWFLGTMPFGSAVYLSMVGIEHATRYWDQARRRTLQLARLSDRLRPEWNIAADTGLAMLPSFALQHLVENAVRHGVSRRTDAGRVTISARHDEEMLELTVTDDGAGLAPDVVWRPGHGLA